MRQAVVIAIVAWLSIACSMVGGREAAPKGFRDAACGAYESLAFAHAATVLGKLTLATGFIDQGRAALVRYRCGSPAPCSWSGSSTCPT